VSYNWIIASSSLLSMGGALLLFFLVPALQKSTPVDTKDRGPYTAAQKSAFRAATLGYFGHMWELYAFWAFVPAVLVIHSDLTNYPINIPLWTFYIIAAGAIGCLGGGALSKKWGSAPVARVSLFFSGCCCLLLPVFIGINTPLFLLFMCAWGTCVVADSPQFTALVAIAAPVQGRGRSISLVTSGGFAITVVSVAVLQQAIHAFGAFGFWVLAIGPVGGLIAFRNEGRRPAD
jgi:hypothetical protein